MNRKLPLFSRTVFSIFAAFVLLISCKKEDQLSEKGNILFVQASPDAPSFDVRNVSVIGASYTSENITGATGISYTSGTPNSGYIGMNASTYYLGFYNAGASSTIAPSFNLNGFTITSDMNSSVFLVNKQASLSVSVVNDDLSVPAPGKAKIRFFNLSPDGPPLNIFMAYNAVSPAPTSIPTTTAAKYTARVFNDQNGSLDNQAFISVPAGYYRIECRTTAGSTLTALTLSSQLLDDGRIYTIYVRGFQTPPSGNTNSLGTKVLINY